MALRLAFRLALTPRSKTRTNIGFGTYPEVSLADAKTKRAVGR